MIIILFLDPEFKFAIEGVLLCIVAIFGLIGNTLAFVFVFREKGPGTCTRARELLPLVTALLGSIDPSLCVLLCPLN